LSPRDIRLPPLNALRVFDAVIRRRSFCAAADELLVTPQAVCRQIKLLEDALGAPLFDREARTIEPTEQAIVLSYFAKAGLGEFTEGVRRAAKTAPRCRINNRLYRSTIGSSATAFT
jgi:LysR family transcriptional regulator, glycine cleavage system transcriptional activator